MTDRELRSLNRRELLELLVEQEKEAEELRRALKSAQDELQSRELNISDCGTMAEAAMMVNNICASADSAAAVYLETVKQRAENAQAECDSLLEAARKKADAIIEEARQKAGQISTQPAAPRPKAPESPAASAPFRFAESSRQITDIENKLKKLYEELN